MGALKQVVDDGWNLDTSLFCDIVRKCVKGPDFKIPAVRSLVAVVLRKVFRLSDEEALELVTRKGLPVQQEFDSECVPPAQWTRPLHLGPSGGRRRTDAGPRPQYGRRHGRGHGQRQPTAGGGASSAGERHHATRLPQTIPPSDLHFRRRQRGGRGVRAPRLPNQLKHLPDPGRSRSGLAQSPQPQPVFAVTVGGAFRARASVVHGWSSGWGVGIGHRPPTGGQAVQGSAKTVAHARRPLLREATSMRAPSGQVPHECPVSRAKGLGTYNSLLESRGSHFSKPPGWTGVESQCSSPKRGSGRRSMWCTALPRRHTFGGRCVPWRRRAGTQRPTRSLAPPARSEAGHRPGHHSSDPQSAGMGRISAQRVPSVVRERP